MIKPTFEQDVELDAKMLLAAMHGTFDETCMEWFDTEFEAYARSEWFMKQPPEYHQSVVDQAIEIEDERRKEKDNGNK